MKVTIVSCVYPPEPIISAKTSAGLAGMLAAGGDDVTVICPFPSRPGGSLYAGFRRRWRQRSTSDGVRIVRCFATVSRRSTLASRMLENVSFGLSSALALAFAKKPDSLYLNTWPLFATAFVVAVARLRRIPFVLSVQDVYPESLGVQGRTQTSGPLFRLLRALDGWIARRASTVLVLSEAWAALYRETRGVDAERLRVQPNWVDEQSVRPMRDEALEWRRANGIGRDGFLLVYGGNVGAAAGVEELIERLAGQPAGTTLLVAGDGARIDACEALAQRVAPDRVLFRRPWPEDETSLVLSAADVLVLPTAGSQSSVSVPSKLTTYMLAGRPVLAIAEPESETASVIERAHAGWTVPPGDAERFAAMLGEIRRLPAESLDATGAAARAFAAQQFGRRAGAAICESVRGAR